MNTRASRYWAMGVLLVSQQFMVDNAAGQTVTVPLRADRWTATDSVRTETYLGRESLYINRGVALTRDLEFRDGIIEFEMAATPRTTFMGVSFHASAPDNSEVVFFRVGQTGTSEAVQYGPAANSLGSAWQVFHGPGANAVANLARETWIPVRIEVAGNEARIFVNNPQTPTLVVPHLAGMSGKAFGVWTGLFGRGAYFSNMRFTPTAETNVRPAPALPPGTIVDWQLSAMFDAENVTPGTLPDLNSLDWRDVRAEYPGIVLINRYHRAPVASLPIDSATRQINVEAVMSGRTKGSKVVYARTFIDADRDGFRRMHFGYSDGVVIYVNRQPLFFGMNAQFFREDGVMSRAGDAVYLPLKRGRNEVVLAVTEFTGGWAFWTRLDN